MMLRVTDTDTGRTGSLVRGVGYVQGGSYVNPGWVIRWDDDEDEEEDETD